MQFAFLTFVLFTSTISSGWTFQPLDPLSSSPMNSMCTDCKKIEQMMTRMLSHQQSQQLLIKALDKYCYEHPVNPLCMDGAKTYIHLIIRYFSAFAKENDDVCSFLGLCAIESERNTAQLTIGLTEQGSLYAKPSGGTSHEVQLNPICTFCLFLIKTIEGMLPKEKTEQAIEDLLKKICDYLPDTYKDTCDTFIETYGRKLIDLLLSSLPPHAVCTALGLCLFPDTPLTLSTMQTDCDSCKILTVLSLVHLGHNATETQISDLLQKICHLHPNAIPQCEGFVKLHGHRLLKNDGKHPPMTACQEDFLCRGQK